MNLGRRRNEGINRTLDSVFIHESVLERMDDVPTHRSRNPPDSSAAVRSLYKIKPRVPMKQIPDT